MSVDRMATVRQQARIEQAIARGHTVERITRDLHVDAETVEATWRRMQARNDDEGRELHPHGTHAAYNRHLGRGETPCEPCVAAQAAYDRDRYSAAPRRSSAGDKVRRSQRRRSA